MPDQDDSELAEALAARDELTYNLNRLADAVCEYGNERVLAVLHDYLSALEAHENAVRRLLPLTLTS